MTIWANISKSSASTYSHQSKSATSFIVQEKVLPYLLIDNEDFLLIDGSRKLIIEPAISVGGWSEQTKN